MKVFWENQVDPLITFAPEYLSQLNRVQGQGNNIFKKLDVINSMDTAILENYNLSSNAHLMKCLIFKPRLNKSTFADTWKIPSRADIQKMQQSRRKLP